MGGLGRKGSERWRRRGSVFSLVPRLRLLSACSALLAGGGGRRGSKFKRAPAATLPAACLTALLMLARILSPASAQVVSLPCNAGYFGETNAVEYKGLAYRTLDGTSPLDTSNSKCQNYDLALPSGWALAADNADSRYVIGSYRWGTHALVVANGYAYWTTNQGSYAGSLWSSGFLSTSGSTYRIINSCNTLILISKSGACTACPAGEWRLRGESVGRVCVCECVLLHCCFSSLSL
jgi:hypothetical protein